MRFDGVRDSDHLIFVIDGAARVTRDRVDRSSKYVLCDERESAGSDSPEIDSGILYWSTGSYMKHFIPQIQFWTKIWCSRKQLFFRLEMDDTGIRLDVSSLDSRRVFFPTLNMRPIFVDRNLNREGCVSGRVRIDRS